MTPAVTGNDTGRCRKRLHALNRSIPPAPFEFRAGRSKVLMSLSRREILKALAGTLAGGAVLGSTQRLTRALAEQGTPPPLVWVNDGGDDHNFLALVGHAAPTFLNLVAEHWDLREYDPLLPTGYAVDRKAFAKAPILIMEALPSIAGEGSALNDRINQVLPQAKAAILLGTDACFGSIHTEKAAIARIENLSKEHKTPLIRLPGIPVPPHHLVGILGHLEFFGFPLLDGLRRPVIYYGETVCRRCEHRGELEQGKFAGRHGEPGCLLRLGCKGPITHNSCSAVRWNNGENWCVGAGGPCTGCSEPEFPDFGGLGLTGALRGDAGGGRSFLLQNVEGIGWGLMGLAAAGIVLHWARRILLPEADESDSRGRGSED